MKEFCHEQLGTLAYELPDEIENYKRIGDYKKAMEAVRRWEQRPVTDGMKTRLELEEYILQELTREYIYTAGQAAAQMKKKVPDFSEEDLQRLDEQGLAEWLMIDGEKRYISSFDENILKVDADMRSRAGISPEADGEKKYLRETICQMKKEGGAVRRFRLRASIRLKEELFRPGMHLKVHLPLPARLHQISDVRVLEHTQAEKVTIDPEDSLYRAICFEDTPRENREYYVVYEYTVHAVYHDLSPNSCIAGAGTEDCREREDLSTSGGVSPRPYRMDSDDIELYTGEQMPHIRFSPYLRDLAVQIAGEERKPLAVARRIYDYITMNVNYSYMREYSLITDIPQYCARNLRGDCGVQALLFITLCRICGIPAKWQSGLYSIPGYVGNHDWAMFYVQPWGWLFADPSFGGSAFRDGDEEKRQFYFGNLDPFRMAANNAFQQPFAVKRKFMPLDPYDNQSGEIESEERGYRRAELVCGMELLREIKLEH